MKLYRNVDWYHNLLVITSIAGIFILFIYQLMHINGYASTWDQVDYALALDRFDIMAMQPHFPGYPYFILGGLFIHQFEENQAASLTVFNILFYFSTIFPIYKLARGYVSKPYSIFIAAMIYSSSYVLVTVNQPMSEGAGLAALWWFFWSIERALQKKGWSGDWLPLVIFSILLGIRLSYLPFGVALIYLFWKKWSEKEYTLKQISLQIVFALMLQLIWVGGLVFSEGNIQGFVKLALAFTSGHFNDWGNTAVTSEKSVWTRVVTLLFNNVFWHGLSSLSIIIAGILIVIWLLGLPRFRWSIKTLSLAYLVASSYFIWALFAQNIEKPRHIVPVVLFILFILFITIAKRLTNPLIGAICIFFLLSNFIQSIQMINEQASEQPASYQLAEYTKTMDKNSMLYTWEETRVLQYLDTPVPHKRILTYEVFLHEMSYYKNKKIYLTSKVIEGFSNQGIDLSGKIKKVKTFQSNPIYDPVYHEITLYQWIQ
ncbi:glycosyltransferase family 39 protein [Neobacillus sp. DY30]|uniref:glycosyltransferase family 39 protein n=1 Tax=Neobacillus sp. DY30 TaxID=3047871 RepID=UPI0024BF1ECE|nr:glycosyltransferase family 39 protein [Neobacillus sp. DY30]WHY00927.1 glycosyltransferase family 39 protein [Neobacillus sp. DY30]